MDSNFGERVSNILKPFILSQDVYVKVRDLMHEDVLKGIAPGPEGRGNLRCLPTYVRAVPDGTESGNFLALDLGGTNFRVLLINLGSGDLKVESKNFVVPQNIMLGTGVQLFDHVADCMHEFIVEHSLQNQTIPLGFCFSFPCKQKGLDKAVLTNWSKGFKCSGLEGEDIVIKFHAALKRRGDMDNIQCLAVVNDTCGALMSAAYYDTQVTIGLILGTGSNSCYIEKLENVKTWEEEYDKPNQLMLNLEWGAFGNNGNLQFFQTEFDKVIDDRSVNPTEQMYEKMIGGMYMGEIVRLVLVKLQEESLLFGGKGSEQLSEIENFPSKLVSEIEGDDINELSATRKILKDYGIQDFSDQDCLLVRHVCDLVSERAAYLASAGVACLLNKVGREDQRVGIEGSLYRYHPRFHNLMMEKIPTLINPGIKFKLLGAKDGSGLGAALVAAVAQRLDKAKDASS